MDREKTKYILDNCLLPDNCKNAEFKETHISWILLSDEYAFKIKRPVRYSFLDFSTLEKRKFYCQEELRLNQRIEPEMYLNVLPVKQNMGIDDKATDDKTIDYAVQMKRMDNSKEMDVMLREDMVTEAHIDALAKKVAQFHTNAQVVKNAFRTQEFQHKYADIEKQFSFIEENLGCEYKHLLQDAIQKSFDYLNAIRSFSNDRVINSFQRDCHGDLNARNIFLYDNPVIFDCIEFNPEYRHIDVLNDIAFLCVDLDFFGKEGFSERFYMKYTDCFGAKDEPDVRQRFNYYKSFRANVRAKVTLISAQKKQEENRENDQEIEDAKKYIRLVDAYLKDFETDEK